MDNTTICIIVAVVVIIIIIALVIGLLFAFMSKPTTSSDNEELIEEDVELTDVVEEDDASSTKYSLYCVPAVQPPLTKEARKYKGYHCTLFPSQKLPNNFNLNEAMENFKTNNTQWNLTLPGITTKVKDAKSKNLAIMMIYGATTLNTLRTYMQTLGWVRPWGSNHLSLGTLDPHDQGDPDDFTHQSTWYVQLVRNPGHHWLPDQRVLLYVAEGKHN